MTYKHIPFGKPREFNVVCEIPTGSKNKYEYDETLDAIKLDFVFRDFEFPFNYGYIPETRGGGDGDHLDAIILNPFPIEQGVVVPCRAIGYVELLDRGQQDDKIVCVPLACAEYDKYQDLSDLDPARIETFKNFFAEIAREKNKVVEIKGFRGKTGALKILEQSKE